MAGAGWERSLGVAALLLVCTTVSDPGGLLLSERRPGLDGRCAMCHMASVRWQEEALLADGEGQSTRILREGSAPDLPFRRAKDRGTIYGRQSAQACYLRGMRC